MIRENALFSETNSKRWINFAIFFAILTGAATTFFAIRNPELLSRWSVIDGVLLFALAYGLWRRSLTCALLLFVHGISSAVVSAAKFGTGFNINVILRLVLYIMATAAIDVEKSRNKVKRLKGQQSPTAHSGADNEQTG